MPKARKGGTFLDGVSFCISGTMSASRAQLTAEIKALGGSVASTVTGKVTHLLTTEAEVAGKTSKVVSAEGKGLPMVGEDFLEACKKAKQIVATAKYELSKPKKKTTAKKPAAKKGGFTNAKKAASSAGSSGTPQVHPRVSDVSAYEVVVQDDVVWDAMLNQQNTSTNTDKFYVLQLLEDVSDGTFVLFQHWGRTGTTGQVSEDDFGEDQEEAISAFEAKFKSKTGSKWEDRENFKQKANKYNFLVQDYDLQRDEDVLWQYHLTNDPLGKSDGWYNYDGDASTNGTATSNMEGYYEEFINNPWLNIRFVASGSFTYKVDFSANEQTNTSSQKSRPIRRHHE